MSTLERLAVQRVIDKARAAGIETPDIVSSALLHADSSAAAKTFAEMYPDINEAPVEATYCCDGAAYRGLRACTCWEPVFDTEQASPVLPTSPDGLGVQPRMCGDCAYRAGSPERAEEFTAEALLELPGRGEPFFCHAGMRRPVEWRHPGLPGVVIPGDPADYQPPMIGGVPFRADGRPGLLCAGWAARAVRTES